MWARLKALFTRGEIKTPTAYEQLNEIFKDYEVSPMPTINIPDDKNIILMCPPLDRFPMPPSGQPGCQLLKCRCNRAMWVSEKKRAIIAEYGRRRVKAICFHCYEQEALADPIGAITAPMFRI